MPTRREKRRVNSAVAVFGLALGGLMGSSYVVVALSEGLLVPKSRVIADFRDTAGIGRNTEVQLAGRLIGKVVEIGFVTETYPCNPQTEDFGHPSQGRTDQCEPWMFCAPQGEDPGVGTCAELEVYSGHPGDYQGCDGQLDSCEADQICVTRAFGQRYHGVRWWGQAGWCVNYNAENQRIRVTMEVDEEALQYIREDSRAGIALNGLLASPVINITVGANQGVIDSGARLQTSLSLPEEVFGLKDQIDKLAEDIDRGLLGLSALTEMLDDEATKADVDAISANVTELREQIASAEGLVGAVLNDPDLRAELSQTMRELRTAATDAQAEFADLERKSKRSIRKVKVTAKQIQSLMESLQDPNNTSLAAVLVNDSHGFSEQLAGLGDEAQETIGAGQIAFADISAALDEIGRAIERREGSLGRLIADPKPLYHLKDPAALRRVNVVKGLVRWVIAAEEDLGSLEPVVPIDQEPTSTPLPVEPDPSLASDSGPPPAP